MPKLASLTRVLPLAASVLFAGSVNATQVVTSIKPLQLIASAIGDGVTEPELLLPENASPHSFTLRPSDMQRLTEAELIFWVGPDLEQSLSRPLQRTNARVVQLYMADAGHDDHKHESEGHGHKHDEHKHDDHDHKHDEHKHDDHDHKHDDHGHKHDEHKHDDHGHKHDEHKHDDHGHKHDEHKHDDHGHKHDEHKHDDHGHKHDGHEHDGHDHDAHIWLDPINGIRIAETMAAAMTELKPEHAGRIAENLQRFKEETQNLDSTLKTQLSELSDKGFFVFHDAYGHFVEHYGLNQLGYFTLDPSRQPGARHLADIRSALEAGEAVCVFSEPQFTPAVVESVVRGIEIRHGVLDPLASDIAVAPGAYQVYLQQLADSFSDCLGS
ncbi:zinc ABC transporter substrate-binding protein [Nitrincola alkalilacustris]|uniref:zinc ABC transporter substrate-binding protein n=1 Tax=Nitrincola alkalilacustris TaxID=1571224 RepID=UPI00124BFBCC|nr:zinc ABC transporter substrate-binding protein [Nitrincola alkalilacustris]